MPDLALGGDFLWIKLTEQLRLDKGLLPIISAASS